MPRRILEGKVVSDKMDKTVMVLVERRTMHPVYKKYIRKSDKYAAHDETNAFRTGDMVQIEECRPLSRNKSWKVITAPVREGAPRVAKTAAGPAVNAQKAKTDKAAKPAKAPREPASASAADKAKSRPAAEKGATASKKPAAQKPSKKES